MHGGGRIEITPEILLRAYAAGIFPMAEDADDPGLFWVEPRERGVLPLDGFHLSKRLARTVRADRFEIRVDRDFDAVIAGCAGATARRDKTWINGRIRRLYGDLFDLGHCHTVEAYREGRLVGGALRRAAGGGVLRREHVPPRARRLEGRPRPPGGAAAGRRLPPPRHPVRDRASRAVRRGRGAAPGIQAAPARGDRRPGRLACVAARADRRAGAEALRALGRGTLS